MKVDVRLLPHQLEFLKDYTTRYLALVGGFGCGKTYSFCIKAIDLAIKNVGYRGVLLEPTNTMIHDVLIPEFERTLEELGIDYEYKASPLPKFTLKFKHGSTEILMRSAENYRRLAGLNLAFYGVDEVDTIEKQTAHKMWRMLQSRLRQGKVYNGFVTSTPEGFSFLYDFFVEDGHKGDRRIIHAKTADNPFLPDDFIPSLLNSYPEHLIKAYLEGQFVNLTSGQIYYSYDRDKNNTNLTLNDFPNHVLHIGQDFNVNKCASVVHIVDKNIPYALDEIVGAKNTEHVIQLIKQRYPNRRIIMYPDASGKNEKTNATTSDIVLLKNAGFELNYTAKNPYVKDRIASVNAALCNANGDRKYFINKKTCPAYTKTLEQQVYNKFGEPDKAHDLDHPSDAAGYFIHRVFPLVKHSSIRTY